MSRPHLSHDDVARLVGDVDETVIASILATGASYAEIEQALKWLGPDAEGRRLDALGLTPTAELFYDIQRSSTQFNGDESPVSR